VKIIFCAGFIVLHTIYGGHAHIPMCDRTWLFKAKFALEFIHFPISFQTMFSKEPNDHNHEGTLQTFA